MLLFDTLMAPPSITPIFRTATSYLLKRELIPSLQNSIDSVFNQFLTAALTSASLEKCHPFKLSVEYSIA